MISMQSFQAQLDTMRSERSEFHQQLDNEEKLFKARLKEKKLKRKLKKRLRDAKKGPEGGKGVTKATSSPSSKKESGEYAVVAAMAMAMKQNMQIIGSKAQQLSDSGAADEINRLHQQLDQVANEQKDLANKSPAAAQEEAKTVQTKLMTLDAQQSNLQTQTSMKVMDLKYYSGQNNSMGGIGQQVVSLLQKEGTSSPV